jgi:Tfp pilus assembly protein PilF
MGMTRSQALISAHLGRYWLDGEHFAEAEQYARESMILATEAGVRLGQMYALHVLACVYAGREELEQAQAMFQQSCQMAHRIGDRRHIADVLRSYGEALALQGQTETAYLALTVAAREYASLEMMDATPTLALQQQQRARIEPSRLQRLDSEAQALSLEGILQAMEPPQITA